MDVSEVLDKGFIAHVKVKTRLLKIINGEEQAEPEDVRSDSKCIVGEWIYGPGTSFATKEEYKTLQQIHKEFHEEAYNALMLKKQGEDAKAKEYVESGPFEKKSQEIKAAITKMKEAAANA